MGKGQRNRRNPDYFKVQGGAIEEPHAVEAAKRALGGERARLARRAGRKTTLGPAPAAQRRGARPAARARPVRPPAAVPASEPPIFDQAAGRLLHAALHPLGTLRAAARHPLSSLRELRSILLELERGHAQEHA